MAVVVLLAVVLGVLFKKGKLGRCNKYYLRSLSIKFKNSWSKMATRKVLDRMNSCVSLLNFKPTCWYENH